MQDVVAADHFRLCIGEKRVVVSRLLAEVARLLRGIHTNRNETNTECIDFRQMIFYAP